MKQLLRTIQSIHHLNKCNFHEKIFFYFKFISNDLYSLSRQK
jgi:hypothetical protein